VVSRVYFFLSLFNIYFLSRRRAFASKGVARAPRQVNQQLHTTPLSHPVVKYKYRESECERERKSREIAPGEGVGECSIRSYYKPLIGDKRQKFDKRGAPHLPAAERVALDTGRAGVEINNGVYLTHPHLHTALAVETVASSSTKNAPQTAGHRK
jgi:hypothetical protein